jgi:NTE family protein
MGALIGALYAKGLSPAQIDAVCYEEFVRRSPVGDYTIPRHALFSGRRGRGMIERIYGEGRFEHMVRDLTVVSTDLYRRELVFQRSGPLFPALASTTLIPGLLPPLAVNGRVLVDGGVLDNLPVHTLSDRGEGPVIAVDVSDRVTSAEKYEGEGPPPLKDILVRALTLGSADLSAATRDAAVLIQPDGDGTGVFEWHQIDLVREAGRRAAQRALNGSYSIASHT